LLLSAGACTTAHAGIDRYPPQTQQTRRPLLLLSIDGTDRRTDGRTDALPLHNANARQ